MGMCKVKRMSLIDVVLSRRSIRRYERKDIPKEVLNKILEAGRQAPSANNIQPFHLIVLTDDEIKREFSTGLWNSFVKDSPVVIVGCSQTTGNGDSEWSVVDTSIALQNMVIAAWAMDVGSCWIGDFEEEKVKRTLDIPESWNVLALITFGYPAEQPSQQSKKPIEELVSYNKF